MIFGAGRCYGEAAAAGFAAICEERTNAHDDTNPRGNSEWRDACAR
jgi:hypothetical protein